MVNSQNQSSRRLGLWSALSIVILGTAYIITGAIWWAGSDRMLSFEPTEPYLTVLESLMLLLSPALVPLFAAIHGSASPEYKSCTLAALCFAIVTVAITCSVHFVQLAVVPQLDPAEVPAMLVRDRWPTVTLALDLLAWCAFLGLALLLAAPSFRGDRLRSSIRITMIVSGLLCLAGTLAPMTGRMQLANIGILGYDFGFLIVCILLAIHYARTITTETQKTEC